MLKIYAETAKDIQPAIDRAYENGGGEVVLPEGEYITGGIRLRSNVTLRLLKGARLIGSRNPEDYMAWREDKVGPIDPEILTDCLWTPARVDAENRDFGFIHKPGSRWNNAVIRALNARNIAIIGEEGSVIDGRDCFDETGEEHYRGPHAINMHGCENVTLSGYTVKNSANWAHALFYCKNVVCRGVSAYAGHDGIHITACRNVEISDCRFFTGDDCVAGFANVNVLVTNTEMNSACSALRFGGTNALIRDCRMYGPARHLFRGSLSYEEKRDGGAPVPRPGHRYNMLSAFTYYADRSFPIPEQPGSIVIKDCKIENADRLLHYNFSGNEPWQGATPLKDICFEGVTATGVKMPLTAYGDKDVKVTLEIRDSDIAFEENAEGAPFMQTCHFDRITLDRVRVTGIKAAPLVKTWSRGGILDAESAEAEGATEKITYTEEKFVCGAI